MDYLVKIWNENDSDDNIDTDDDLRFAECDTDLSDENLVQDNHTSESEIQQKIW